MFNLLFFISILFLSSIKGDDTEVKSLCEDPLIHSADRLVNKTVRLYRGQYYWELIGLPAETVKVEGPFKIWNLNMGTFSINNALVTILEGNDIGSTYKTDGQRYWAWDKNGRQFAGAVRGNFWDLIPEGGFEAAFHDSDKNNPTVVGFKGIYVYYFSTKDKVWTGDKKGYLRGKYGENFPTDLTASFSWPADDPKDGYIVYLFKRKKYCKRTKFMKSGENCQWIDNKVLFGCPAIRAQESNVNQSDTATKNQEPTITSGPTSSEKIEVSVSQTQTVSPVPTVTPTNNSHHIYATIPLIYLLICFKFIL